MKKLLLFLSIGAVCASVAQGQKMDYDFYATARGGYSILDKATVHGAGGGGQNISFDNGVFAALAIGLRNPTDSMGSGFRLEAEGSWLRNDLKDSGIGLSGNAQSFRLFANLYYDQALTKDVYLYIGGGVGGVQYRMKMDTALVSGKDHDTVLGYQGMVGLGLRLTDYLTLETGYRITSSSDPKFDLSGSTVKMDAPLTHIFEMGIRVEF